MPKETAYIHTQTAALVSEQQSIESLISNSSSLSAKGANAADIPTAKELNALYDSIKSTVLKIMTKRGEVCDRSMRQLAQKRKERIAMEREQEAARAEEEAKRAKAERKKVGKKRSADEMEGVEKMKEEEIEDEKGGLPNVGAHGVARQDGVGLGEGESNQSFIYELFGWSCECGSAISECDECRCCYWSALTVIRVHFTTGSCI